MNVLFHIQNLRLHQTSKYLVAEIDRSCTDGAATRNTLHLFTQKSLNRKIGYKVYICIYYINILHKNYTYVIRKRNLTTSLLFQNFTTCFDPYGPSSGDIFEDFLLYWNTSIICTSVRLSIAS
jgi:hypothetical protein